MFNSTSSSDEKVQKAYIPVILTLVTGETLKGAIAINANSRLGDLLNGTDKYVLFKTNKNEPIYLSQATIAAVQSNEKPSARQLEISLRQMKDVNPYHILKIKPGADKATIRNAYHQLVKQYHPDQFANTVLPEEVHTYLDTVILRLNAAYQELMEELNRLERFKKMQAATQKVPDLGEIRYFGQ